MIKKNSQEKGQALILIALAAIVLFGFTALAIDSSRAFSDKRHAQNAADTASLAAALAKIRGQDYVLAATNRATSNGYTTDADTVVMVNLCSDLYIDPTTGIAGTNPETGLTTITCPGLPASAQLSEYIRVRIVSTIPTTFGRVIGRDTMQSAVQAISRATTGTSGGSGGGHGYGITTLKQGCVGGDALKLTGSGKITIQGDVGNNGCMKNDGSGDKQIDGDLEISYFLNDGASANWTVGGNVWLNGFSKSGSGDWTVAGSYFNNGTFSVSGSSDYIFGSFTNVGAYSKGGGVDVTPWPPSAGTAQTPQIITDPYATVLNPPPNPGGCVTVDAGGSTDVVLNPGCYEKIRRTGSGKLTFNPGIYYISGPDGISASGTGDVTANGVMIYVEQGPIALDGSGNLTISPMTSGDYKGLSIYMDRSNVQGYSMSGSGSSSFTGTIYAPSSYVKINGSGGTLVVDSQILCYTAELIGSGNLQLNYTPANNYNPLPGTEPNIQQPT
jgi:Flp pilus assembly protein TadG